MEKEQKGPGCGRARRRFRGGPWGRGCRGERNKGGLPMSGVYGFPPLPHKSTRLIIHTKTEGGFILYVPDPPPLEFGLYMSELRICLGPQLAQAHVKIVAHNSFLATTPCERENHTKLHFPCIRELLLSTATPIKPTSYHPLPPTQPQPLVRFVLRFPPEPSSATPPPGGGEGSGGQKS